MIGRGAAIWLSGAPTDGILEAGVPASVTRRTASRATRAARDVQQHLRRARSAREERVGVCRVAEAETSADGDEQGAVRDARRHALERRAQALGLARPQKAALVPEPFVVALV